MSDLLPFTDNGAGAPGSATRSESNLQPQHIARSNKIKPHARWNAPRGTSDEAARRIAGHAGTLRAAVLAWIVGCGDHGGTDDEGEAALGIRCQTWTPRRGELVKLGLVVDSGRRRPTSSGRPAAVWVAATLAAASGGAAAREGAA